MGHHVNISTQLQRFYIADLLRHLIELMEVLKSEPMGKYEGEKINSHTFVYKFNDARNIAGITQTVFDSWCEEVKDGFMARNLVSLPIKMCENMPGIMIDTRSFMEITKINCA